jgi:hypothetical protein
MTTLRIAQFAAILSTALALVPAAAHAMELRQKIRMSRADYLVTQRIYRGWSLAAIVVIAALASTIAVASLSPDPFARVAVALIVGTQLVFWIFTFPVNRRTENWSRAPEDWQGLRRRWELSHAVSALLNLVALICVVVSVLSR